MAALFLQKLDYEVLVVGPIYDRIEKIKRIYDLSQKYNTVILNGNLCNPMINDIEENFKIISELFSDKILYNACSDDLVFSQNNPKHQISKWINKQPNVIVIEFSNQTSTIITNGGVTPKMSKNILKNNIETSFVSHIDGMPWHNKYYGNYGYVISNNPLTIEKPKFYSYSLQMGNKYESNWQTYAQEVGPKGLKQTILL